MDSFIIAVISIVSGALLGVANSVFGMIKDGELFNVRKFAITVVTGIIAGVVLVMGQISGLLTAVDATDLLLQLVGLGLMIFGANFTRTVVTGALKTAVAGIETTEVKQPTS